MGRILLVRHGQASSGEADYDVLSAVGELQASFLGAELACRGLRPTILMNGDLQRQRRTAELAQWSAGWDMVAAVDPRWNEFDHRSVLDAAGVSTLIPSGGPPVEERQEFALDHALPRWIRGDGEYAESFTAFSRRADAAFDSVAQRLGSGEVAVVVTSAGVISRTVARLVGAGAEQWLAFNRVAVNAAITTVAVGRRGATLISFNEHAHFPKRLQTYR